MPRTAPPNARTRRRAYLSAMALVLAAVTGGATGALGAGSPSEAVETLVDRIVSGGFDDLTGVVCPEFEDDIRAEFDPTASDATFGSLQVDVSDPVVTVVSEDDASAVVNLTGSMRISFDEVQAREFVRAQLEASGHEPTEQDVDDLLGLMFPAQDLPIDEDLTVVESDGEWLICGTERLEWSVHRRRDVRARHARRDLGALADRDHLERRGRRLLPVDRCERPGLLLDRCRPHPRREPRRVRRSGPRRPRR